MATQWVFYLKNLFYLVPALLLCIVNLHFQLKEFTDCKLKIDIPNMVIDCSIYLICSYSLICFNILWNVLKNLKIYNFIKIPEIVSSIKIPEINQVKLILSHQVKILS